MTCQLKLIINLFPFSRTFITLFSVIPTRPTLLKSYKTSRNVFSTVESFSSTNSLAMRRRKKSSMPPKKKSRRLATLDFKIEKFCS